MRDTKNFRLRLEYWRRRRVMNIRQLSEKAKVSSATIVRVENDSTYIPRSDVIRKLATALDVQPEDLLVDESEEKPSTNLAMTA